MDQTLQQILNYLITLQAERNALVEEVTKLRAQVASAPKEAEPASTERNA